MEISYRNAEENGEYVEALSHSVISEPLIKIFLLSDGSNIMAEEIDREIGVKKRKGKKKKKKNTDLSLKSRRKQFYGAGLPNIE